MQMRKKDTSTAKWIIITLLMSSLCYFPMMLENLGVIVPNVIISVKYFFVILPFLITIFFKLREKELKQWLIGLFTFNNKKTAIIMCGSFIIIGLTASCIYALATNKPDLFKKTYPGLSSVIGGGIYLYITALFEEMAWRGFLLDRIVAVKKWKSLVCIGVTWGIWHIPMWAIRNLLGAKEIIYFFVWTFLVSLILGTIYLRCRNILVTAFLHFIFNFCFLSPVSYNIAVLTLIIVVMYAINKRKSGQIPFGREQD